MSNNSGVPVALAGAGWITQLLRNTVKGYAKALGGYNEQSGEVDVLQLNTDINPAEVPKYITESVKRLDELSKKVDAAIKAGRDATEEADRARGKKATFSWYESSEKEREVIEALQSSGKKQAEAIAALSEAQKVQFDCLNQVSHIMKGLFILGCSSLAMNRSVVRELEARLRGASEEELSDMAIAEINAVITQLNEQRALFERQEKLGETQEEQAKRISENRGLINDNFKQDQARDAELKRQADKDVEHDRLIEKNFVEDERREAEIRRLSEELVKLTGRVNKYILNKWMCIGVAAALVVSLLLSIIALVLSICKA